ncbi:hypothetical protein [Nocardia goodfellowii]|uniref:Uncharacterized protein n=1 Tax=Nocardia goodfellowii TaxID=882446 RepID=A0ABS4QS26_9NOCA|nr:hypothetical protein [Nocardia goodfellowii]MBP2194500.1 hypothetical protein [Nocardia goodfellowii]
MTLNRKQLQQFSARAGVIGAVAVAGMAGFAGPSAALPTDPAARFTPTLTRVGGPECAAIITAEVVPQPKSGEFGVRPKITQVGEFCSRYKVAVRWKNLDTGRENGQQHPVDEHGVIQHTVDGVIIGFGMGPGAGRVEARIVTLNDRDQELQQISGTATFTLG